MSAVANVFLSDKQKRHHLTSRRWSKEYEVKNIAFLFLHDMMFIFFLHITP